MAIDSSRNVYSVLISVSFLSWLFMFKFVLSGFYLWNANFISISLTSGISVALTAKDSLKLKILENWRLVVNMEVLLSEETGIWLTWTFWGVIGDWSCEYLRTLCINYLQVPCLQGRQHLTCINYGVIIYFRKGVIMGTTEVGSCPLLKHLITCHACLCTLSGAFQVEWAYI